MELKNYFAQDDAGNVLPGAECSVFFPGTTERVTTLENANGGPRSNPFFADSRGLIQFAAPNGRYDLQVKSGALSYTIRVQCADLDEAAAAAEASADAAAASAAEAASAVSDFAADLANPTDPAKGAAIVGRGVVAVDSIADLISQPVRDDLRYAVRGYHAGSDVGGGDFYWAAGLSKTQHDGCTVIDPDRSFPASWDSVGISAWFAASVSGAGCFVRVFADTANLFDFGAIDGGELGEELAAYNNYLRSSGLTGVATGSYDVTAPFLIDMESTTSIVDLNLTTLNTSDVGVVLKCRESQWKGQIKANCGPVGNTLPDYLARRQKVGIQVADSRIAIGGRLHAEGAKQDAIVVGNGLVSPTNNNMASFDLLVGRYSGAVDGVISVTPTSIVNSGAATSAGQRCTITTSDTIDENLESRDFVKVNGQLLWVESVNVGTGTIVAYPQATDTSLNPVGLLIGGGIKTEGVDSNVMGVGVIDTVGVPVGAKFGALYGPNVGRLHVGSGSVGMVVDGPTPTSSNLGGVVGYLYTESLPVDIIEVSVASKKWVVESGFRDPLVHTALLPTNFNRLVRTGTFSESSTPVFTGVKSLGNQVGATAYLGAEYSYITPASAGSYMLLLRDQPQSGYINGHIIGKHVTTNAAGQQTADAHVIIATGAGASRVRYISATGSGIPRLVTLTYAGEQWIALDVTSATATYSSSAFSGVHQNASFTWVSAGSVTDVVAITDSLCSTRINGKLEVSRTGQLLPVSDASQDLGSLALRWNAAHIRTIYSAPVAVASLPTPTAGARAFVSDATATTLGSVVTGGGANAVPVYGDGSSWRIG